MKKKISSIAGVTLIEILIGILISVIMMGAMFTSYTAVDSTYRQVTDCLLYTSPSPRDS